MKHLASIITLLLVTNLILCQDCPTQNIFINSNAKLLEFISDFPNCVEISTSLTISNTNDIENLDLLQQIESIHGGLSLTNNSELKTLSGFQNLRYSGGNVRIQSNPLLDTINQFQSLDTIKGSLTITTNSSLLDINDFHDLESVTSISINNPILESINGFNLIDSLSQNLAIGFCDSLKNISGFTNLEYCDFLDLTILGNLKSIDAFQNLKETGFFATRNCAIENWNNFGNLRKVENLTIQNCNNFINFEGLNNLNSISNHFNIDACASLFDLKGLDNLEVVENSLTIQSNQSLQSLEGLGSLNRVNDLFIENNSSLINLIGLTQLKVVEDRFDIEGNLNIENCIGLESIDSIGTELNTFGSDNRILICSNPSLSSLDGLENLKFIGENLYVFDNETLKEITGIQNTNISNLSLVAMKRNPQLDFCSINNICTFLETNSQNAQFEDNGTKCNSISAINEECETSSTSNPQLTHFTIYPNPSSSEFHLNANSYEIKKIEVYNSNFSKVIDQINLTKGLIRFEVPTKGIYYLKIYSNDKISSYKLIKV